MKTQAVVVLVAVLLFAALVIESDCISPVVEKRLTRAYKRKGQSELKRKVSKQFLTCIWRLYLASLAFIKIIPVNKTHMLVGWIT